LARRASLLVATLVAGCVGSIDDLAPFLAADDVFGADATDASIDATLDAPGLCSLDVERDLLGGRCASASCHGGADPAAGLDLASPNVGRRLANVRSRCGATPLVAPGDPNGSLLFQKVSMATPACGARMPLDGTLSPAEIACLGAWITRWAPRFDADAAVDARADVTDARADVSDARADVADVLDARADVADVLDARADASDARADVSDGSVDARADASDGAVDARADVSDGSLDARVDVSDGSLDARVDASGGSLDAQADVRDD
jgi:hypothetical protein